MIDRKEIITSLNFNDVVLNLSSLLPDSLITGRVCKEEGDDGTEFYRIPTKNGGLNLRFVPKEQIAVEADKVGFNAGCADAVFLDYRIGESKVTDNAKRREYLRELKDWWKEMRQKLARKGINPHHFLDFDIDQENYPVFGFGNWLENITVGDFLEVTKSLIETIPYLKYPGDYPGDGPQTDCS